MFNARFHSVKVGFFFPFFKIFINLLLHLYIKTKSKTLLYRYEIRDPHLVEENVLQILKERADFDNYKPRPFNMREFYDRTGHDIKDMLLSCYYRGMECSAEDFKVVSQACQ